MIRFIGESKGLKGGLVPCDSCNPTSIFHANAMGDGRLVKAEFMLAVRIANYSIFMIGSPLKIG